MIWSFFDRLAFLSPTRLCTNGMVALRLGVVGAHARALSSCVDSVSGCASNSVVFKSEGLGVWRSARDGLIAGGSAGRDSSTRGSASTGDSASSDSSTGGSASIGDSASRDS